MDDIQPARFFAASDWTTDTFIAISVWLSTFQQVYLLRGACNRFRQLLAQDDVVLALLRYFYHPVVVHAAQRYMHKHSVAAIRFVIDEFSDWYVPFDRDGNQTLWPNFKRKLYRYNPDNHDASISWSDGHFYVVRTCRLPHWVENFNIVRFSRTKTMWRNKITPCRRLSFAPFHTPVSIHVPMSILCFDSHIVIVDSRGEVGCIAKDDDGTTLDEKIFMSNMYTGSSANIFRTFHHSHPTGIREIRFIFVADDEQTIARHAEIVFTPYPYPAAARHGTLVVLSSHNCKWFNPPQSLADIVMSRQNPFLSNIAVVDNRYAAICVLAHFPQQDPRRSTKQRRFIALVDLNDDTNAPGTWFCIRIVNDDKYQWNSRFELRSPDKQTLVLRDLGAENQTTIDLREFPLHTSSKMESRHWCVMTAMCQTPWTTHFDIAGFGYLEQPHVSKDIDRLSARLNALEWISTCSSSTGPEEELKCIKTGLSALISNYHAARGFQFGNSGRAEPLDAYVGTRLHPLWTRYKTLCDTFAALREQAPHGVKRDAQEISDSSSDGQARGDPPACKRPLSYDEVSEDENDDRAS